MCKPDILLWNLIEGISKNTDSCEKFPGKKRWRWYGHVSPEDGEDGRFIELPFHPTLWGQASPLLWAFILKMKEWIQHNIISSAHPLISFLCLKLSLKSLSLSLFTCKNSIKIIIESSWGFNKTLHVVSPLHIECT